MPSSDPRTFKIEGNYDDESGGGCFWIVDEAGDSQSLNFGSRPKAQAHLDWLIREAERIANQLPWPPGSGV